MSTRFGHCMRFVLRVLLACVLAGSRSGFCQLPDEPVAGAVQVSNGMIFRGMCSPADTFDDALPMRLELREIDQGYRRILVSTRHSEPPVVNPNDWPNQTFVIPQQRTGARPIPDVIGAPQKTPFDASGQSTIRLRMPGNRVEEIRVGVSKINELFAEIRGLTHNWEYKVPLNTFPTGTLYPGFLERVEEFDTNPFRRLELARILMKADRPTEAAVLLDRSYNDFPELRKQEEELTQGLRTQLAREALEQIRKRHAAGQREFVKHAARVFPEKNLVPVVVVQVRQLGEECREAERRVDRILARLSATQSRIVDEEQRRQAMEMINVLRSELTPHGLDQLAAFELLADADDTPPESEVALAISGWLIGAENAVRSLSEAWGLFRTRERVLDFLRSDDSETVWRDTLLSEIRSTEGLGVDRLAAMIGHLPPARPVPLSGLGAAAETFSLTGDATTAGCQGLVPPEYSTGRSYPLLIAFPPESLTAEATIDFWRQPAELNGWIVVVPELYDRNTVSYDASADQHRRFLNLLRRLKHGLRVDDNRVVIAGHGMGGEAAVDLATSHPDLFAGVASIASPGRRLFQWTAHNDMHLPWYVVIGTRQHLWRDRSGLLYAKLFRLSDQRAFLNALLVKYPERGFESYFEELPSLFDWMSRCERRVWPERIDAVVTRSTDTRWSWLTLDTIEPRFVSMDGPSTWDQRPRGTGTISARMTSANAFLLRTLPGDASLQLNPNIPGLDVEQPITIVAGRTRMKINYAPDIADLLTTYRRTGDRKRLCFMHVDIR